MLIQPGRFSINQESVLSPKTKYAGDHFKWNQKRDKYLFEVESV